MFPSILGQVTFGSANSPLHFSSESTKEFNFNVYGAGMTTGASEYAPYPIPGTINPLYNVDYTDLFNPNKPKRF